MPYVGVIWKGSMCSLGNTYRGVSKELYVGVQACDLAVGVKYPPPPPRPPVFGALLTCITNLVIRVEFMTYQHVILIG